MLRAEWMYDYISPRGNYLLNVLNAKETLTFGRQYRGITYLREVCENLERIVKLPENGLQQSGKLSGETVLAENQPGEQDVILQLPGGVYNFGSETTQSMSMTETLLDIIPVNIFNSLSEGNMLQIIVFALILGVILANMGDRVDIVKNFFGQFNDIMMEMTMAVMKLAPIGVFC